MTPAAQRIAIAEACGWVWKEDVYNKMRLHCPPDHNCPPYSGDGYEAIYCEVPDYLNDLNAMHEAEKSLQKTPDKWILYISILQNRTDYQFGGACAWISATAAQRAEALLRTIGKWEDGHGMDWAKK